MVHKCSEYKLQFRQLSNDIRTEIWKENMSFRENQRRNNLSDHYWRYQLINDTCECDDAFESICEEETHGCQPQSSLVATIDHLQDHEHSGSVDQAVQTPDWTVTHGKPDDVETIHSAPTSPSKETWTEGLKKRPASEIGNCQRNNSAPVALTGSRPENKDFISSLEQRPYPNKTELWKNINNASHLNPSPTRDALKFFKKERKPVFVAFGWNDGDKDVGSKRTHNVLAPQDQVNPLALQAFQKRQNDLQRYLASKRGWNKHQQSLLSLVHIDSNIWMTEYQEKYCKESRDFIKNPNKIYSHRRPVVWRHS